VQQLATDCVAQAHADAMAAVFAGNASRAYAWRRR
jgi:hypothetical protein